MSSNKTIRKELREIYGKGCMFDKAKIAKKIEEIGGIKTYKKFVKDKHYTSSKIHQLEKSITLHHLQHRSEGGRTDLENGANVSALVHEYLHSLPREDEEIINNILREWKKEHYKECEVVIDDTVKIPIKVGAKVFMMTERELVTQTEQQKELQEDLMMEMRY